MANTWQIWEHRLLGPVRPVHRAGGRHRTALEKRASRPRERLPHRPARHPFSSPEPVALRGGHIPTQGLTGELRAGHCPCHMQLKAVHWLPLCGWNGCDSARWSPRAVSSQLLQRGSAGTCEGLLSAGELASDATGTGRGASAYAPACWETHFLQNAVICKRLPTWKPCGEGGSEYLHFRPILDSCNTCTSCVRARVRVLPFLQTVPIGTHTVRVCICT